MHDCDFGIFKEYIFTNCAMTKAVHSSDNVEARNNVFKSSDDVCVIILELIWFSLQNCIV